MTGLDAPPRPEYGALLDALSEAVLLLDSEGRIMFANRRAVDMFGYEQEDLAGARVEMLLPARYRRGERQVRSASVLSGRSSLSDGGTFDLHGQHREGHEVAVEVTISRAIFDDAPIAVLTVREIADRERIEAMHRLAAIVESSADAILTTDLEGVITSWNGGAQHMYGYSAEEAIGRPVSLLIDDARAHEMGEILACVKRGEPVQQMETVRICKNGQAMAVSLSVSPLRDGRGRITGGATVARDITERKRADERMRALIESAPDAVVVVGEGGRMILVNRQTEELFGYSREELLGNEVEMLIPERLRELEAHRVGNFADPETRHTGAALELFGQRADGNEFPIEMTFSPLNTDEGVLVYAAIRDITERKLIDEELRRSNHDLEQFAYVASHDLSEPLRVIAGFVDLLARRYRGQLDDDADRFIDFTVAGVERMQALIDDLLAYSRAGRLQITPREVSVEAVVRDVLWTLEPQLRARGVEVELGELPSLRAERALLRQVFQNLITNAVKFTDADQPRVRIGARRLSSGWRFEVEDNGPGIEARHAERVFEMFQRLHGRDVEGSGMGLAIVKRLVERHGGQVRVTPAEPRGSVFSFTIPDRTPGS